MNLLTRNAVVTLVLVLTFAALVTVHVAIVYGLGRKRRTVGALLSFFVPPSAPYWAIHTGMRARAIVWLALAVAYVGALFLAR